MIYTFDINSSDIPNTFITCIKKFLGQHKLFATDEDNVCVKYVNSHGSTVYVPLSSIKKYVKRFVDGKQFLYIYKWEDKYFAKYYDADNYLRYIFT